MVVSSAVMAVASIALSVLAQFFLYRLPLIILIEVIVATSNALFFTASVSVVPELLPVDKVTAGFRMQKSGQSLGHLLGSAIGGIVLMVGTTAALWLFAMLLAISCAFAMNVPKTSILGAGNATTRGWLSELRAGFAAKWHIKVERWWTLVSFVSAIFLVPTGGMLLPVKVQSLKLPGAWLGICEMALSAGMLAGALGVSAYLAARFGRFAVYTSAVMCAGLGFAIVGISHEPSILLIALAFVGLCMTTAQLVGQTHRMLATPPAFRARMTVCGPSATPLNSGIEARDVWWERGSA